MKIRVLSDLHRQINKNYPLELVDNDVFTLVAGDLGPDYKDNAEWVKRNIRKGALISGNHDAYGTSEDFTLDDVKDYFNKEFPLDSDVTYFDSDVGVVSKKIDDNILLVADVLYTDYEFKCFPHDDELTRDEIVKYNIHRAAPKMSGSYMNDFFFFARDKENAKPSSDGLKNGVRYISPEMYLEHFNNAFSEITKIVEENKNTDVILMTHHCLSPICIGEYMDKGSLLASYVSDKEDWIKSHENIRLVVSGHAHNQKEFNIGNALYVMNPLGYCKNHHDRGWTPDCFVDTETWTVERTPYVNEYWERQHKKDDDKFNAYSACFV